MGLEPVSKSIILQQKLRIGEIATSHFEDWLAAYELKREARVAEDLAEHDAVIALAERRGYSSLPEGEWGVTFDSMTVTDDNRRSIARVRSWERGMKKGAILYGPVGTGKSTLCKALINRWAAPDFRCVFVSVPEALNAMRAAIDKKTNTTVEMEHERLNLPALLVLDDLGADNTELTPWVKEQIFSIFDSRGRVGKPTWFTTNLNSERIKTIYGPRIHDRMLEFCSWVDVMGDSFRSMNFRNEI